MTNAQSKIIYGEENEHIFPKPTPSRRDIIRLKNEFMKNMRYIKAGHRRCMRMGGSGQWDIIIKFCYIRNEHYIERHYSILPEGGEYV